MPSILIVDDDLLAREGIKHLLAQQYRNLTFGEAVSSEEAVLRLARRGWDMAIIDVSILRGDGHKLLHHVRLTQPTTRVLILSRHSHQEHASRARRWKASGYTGKNVAKADMLKGFHRVLAGHEYFDPIPADETSPTPAHRPPALSVRERDVLKACVEGKRIGEIASEFGLSIKTVSTYKRRLLDKLHLNSVAELVRYSLEHHLF